MRSLSITFSQPCLLPTQTVGHKFWFTFRRAQECTPICDSIHGHGQEPKIARLSKLPWDFALEAVGPECIHFRYLKGDHG